MTELIDMSISGAGKMPGGEYRNVTISGAGKIEGSLRCASLDVSGSGKVQGDVDCAGGVDCSGAAKIEGRLSAESFDCSGAVTVEGECSITGKLKASGAGKFKGNLRAELVELSGEIACGGDVSAERFFSEGGCRIEGLLNAESVELKLHHSGSIGSIGGSNILVRKKRSFSLFSDRSGGLWTESIEGDCVDLEYTEAAVVRGKNVNIGAGCRIGRVEYSENLTTAADAIIGEKVRI